LRRGGTHLHRAPALRPGRTQRLELEVQPSVKPLPDKPPGARHPQRRAALRPGSATLCLPSPSIALRDAACPVSTG
jgi:hypothetical protein